MVTKKAEAYKQAHKAGRPTRQAGPQGRQTHKAGG